MKTQNYFIYLSAIISCFVLGSCAVWRVYTPEVDLEQYLLWRDDRSKDFSSQRSLTFEGQLGYETLSFFQNEEEWKHNFHMDWFDQLLIFEKDFLVVWIKPDIIDYPNALDIYYRKKSQDKYLTVATLWYEDADFNFDFGEYNIEYFNQKLCIYKGKNIILEKRVR